MDCSSSQWPQMGDSEEELVSGGQPQLGGASWQALANHLCFGTVTRVPSSPKGCRHAVSRGNERTGRDTWEPKRAGWWVRGLTGSLGRLGA